MNWIRLTVPELGRLQFSIDRQLKVPIFTFFGHKGSQISNLIFLTPKGTILAETTYNDVLSVGVCPKMRPVGVSKKGKKGQKLSYVKLAICPDHPRRRRPLKFCMRGRVREVVIYFKFHENRLRGLRAVEGRKSPSPIDLAHGLYNSLYYRTSRDTNVMFHCFLFNSLVGEPTTDYRGKDNLSDGGNELLDGKRVQHA